MWLYSGLCYTWLVLTGLFLVHATPNFSLAYLPPSHLLILYTYTNDVVNLCNVCIRMLSVSMYCVCRVNAISNARVMGDDYNEGICGKKAARVWLFFGFLFVFAGLIGSLWVFIQVFLVPGGCAVCGCHEGILGIGRTR